MTEFGEGSPRDPEATQAWMNSRPLASDLGFVCEEIEPGYAVWTWDPPDRWLNPNRSVPGAMIAALADHVAGTAVVSLTGQDAYTATVELTTRFLRAVFKTPIRVTASVVRRGRRLAYLRVDVYDGDGDLVADGTATFFIEAHLGRAHPIGRERP